MSVSCLKDGRWVCRFYDATGKGKAKYFGRGLEAEKAAHSFNESLDIRPMKKRTPARGSAYFRDLVQVYTEAKMGINSESTLDNFLLKMKGVIMPEIGATQAIRLTTHRLDQYVTKRIKAGVKKTTIHREISDIQAVLNWAVGRKYLAFNPVEKYKKPKRDDEVIRPPTTDEINALIDNSPDHLARALTLSFFTGIRPGKRELLSRCWHDIDWQEKTIFVVSAKKGGDIKYRSIPLHPELFTLLQKWHDADRFWAIEKKRPLPDRIIHWHGKPVLRISKAFYAAKKRAAITRRLRPYDFRHAFASWALKRNANLKATSELLGHSRTDTTTRIYQHTDTAMHQDVINLLPGLVHKKYVPKQKPAKPHE